jgi:hypothetical protein
MTRINESQYQVGIQMELFKGFSLKTLKIKNLFNSTKSLVFHLGFSFKHVLLFISFKLKNNMRYTSPKTL